MLWIIWSLSPCDTASENQLPEFTKECQGTMMSCDQELLLPVENGFPIVDGKDENPRKQKCTLSLDMFCSAIPSIGLQALSQNQEQKCPFRNAWMLWPAISIHSGGCKRWSLFPLGILLEDVPHLPKERCPSGYIPVAFHCLDMMGKLMFWMGKANVQYFRSKPISGAQLADPIAQIFSLSPHVL